MYEIHILNNEEFNGLEESVTRGSDISDSLGFADPKTQKAYVRYSEVQELQKYLIDHEMDELVQSSSGHEDEHGIRHKKFRQAAGNIGAVALPILGNAIAPGIGGVIGGAAGGALKGGIGGEKKSVGGALKGGAIGAGAGLGANMLTGNMGMSSGSGFSSFLPNLKQGAGSLLGLKNIGSNLGNLGGKITGMFGGGGALPKGANITSTMQGPYNPQTGQLWNNPITQATAGMTGISSGDQQEKSLLSKFGGLFKNKGLWGAGLLGAGLMKSYPKVSDYEQPQSKVDLSNYLKSELSQQYDPMNEAEIQAATRQLDEQQKSAEDQIRDTYKSIRPGSDEFTDSAFRDDLNDIRQRFAQAKADTVAQRTRDTKAIYQSQRNTQMGQLAQLAQMDVNQIAAQLNIDLQSAQNFKDTFMGLGEKLILDELAPSANLMSLFGG